MEGDDIVYCSDCEMPHHKECWIENQGCTTFGCTGTIQGAKSAGPDQPLTLYCPNCGAQQNAASQYCSRCGNALRFERQAQPYQSYREQPYNSAGPSQTYNSYGRQPQFGTVQTGQYAQPASGDNSETAFIGDKSYYYIPKFNELRAAGTKSSWNWAAFFIPAYWSFYRKLYAAGCIILGIYFITAFLGTFGIIVNFAINITMGIMGNYFYMRHVADEIGKARMAVPMEQLEIYIAQRGGTNAGAAVGVFAGYFVLALLINL
jgi:hypothetical protein